MTALRLCRKGTAFVSAIILARLLSPSDYGLAAVGLLCVTMFQTFTEVGVRPFLVQDGATDVDLLNTAWTVEVLRGLLVATVVFIVAPRVAAFFEAPAAVPLIRAMSLIPVIKLSCNIRTVFFQRDLEFHKQFVYEFSGVVSGIVTGVVAAVILRNAWALVLGQLATHFVCTCLSYVYFPERPVFNFNLRLVRKVLHFGKWVFLSVLVGYFAMEGDKIVVGRKFGMAVLGGYKMAAMFVNTVVYELGKNITHVFFPAYVKIRDDRPKLRRFFLRLYAMLVAILAPICLWMFLSSPDLLRVVLGSKWTGSAPALSMLALAGMVQVFVVAGSGLFYALQRPQYKTFCEAVSLVALLAFLFYLPSRFGVVGVCTALLLSSVLACCLHVGLWMSLLEISFREFAGMHTATVCSLGLMWMGMTLCGREIESVYLRFVLTSFAGAVSYLCGQMVAARIFHVGPMLNVELLFCRHTK